jgi:hypothetical protein
MIVKEKPLVGKYITPSIAIGIDPGVNTGLAVWDCITEGFIEVGSYMIHEALIIVADYAAKYPSAHVYVEDARLRRWFGNSGAEKWKGAGSIMRDSTIWDNYLESLSKKTNLTFRMIPPKQNKTKLSAASFGRMTGWNTKTNEHARDAAMLVFHRSKFII